MDLMNVFLSRPLIARLATVSAKTLQPHVVPIWYDWDGESLWISSYRSSRKIRDLEGNPLASVVIDVDEAGADPRAVLFEGRVVLIDTPRPIVEEISARIYRRYLGAEGVLAAEPQEWLHSPENLLVQLKPSLIKSWK